MPAPRAVCMSTAVSPKKMHSLGSRPRPWAMSRAGWGSGFLGTPGLAPATAAKATPGKKWGTMIRVNSSTLLESTPNRRPRPAARASISGMPS